MPDVGTRIALPSRSLVRPPVDERVSARAANPATDPASRADETEADTPQRVTADPAAVDTERDSSYGDAVRGHCSDVPLDPDTVTRWGEPYAQAIARTMEREPPPRPLESLLADLDVHLFLDPQLRARFTDFYAQSPERASRLAAHTLEGAQNGSLARPDAYLASRLRKM